MSQPKVFDRVRVRVKPPSRWYTGDGYLKTGTIRYLVTPEMLEGAPGVYGGEAGRWAVNLDDPNVNGHHVSYAFCRASEMERLPLNHDGEFLSLTRRLRETLRDHGPDRVIAALELAKELP